MRQNLEGGFLDIFMLIFNLILTQNRELGVRSFELLLPSEVKDASEYHNYDQVKEESEPE